MKILLLSVGDNGGGCYWLADAINKHTKHTARSARFVQSWINYPYDIFAPSKSELEALMKWADVLHIRDNVSDKWPGIPAGKPVVVTWTGMSYRRRAAQKLEGCKARGWVATVSTPDLVSYAPENLKPLWLPNPREKMERTNQDIFAVCHAPTFRERKGTENIISACRQIGVSLKLIEEKTYTQSLNDKLDCNVTIDQVGSHSFGYGNNAIEAWAMDMPVISGAGDEEFTQHVIDLFGELPYMDCDGSVEDISECINALTNNEIYHRYVDKGQEYFYQFHHAPVVARGAIQIYETLL